MQPFQSRRANAYQGDLEQRALNFSPIEATPEERARVRRQLAEWTRDEEAEEFAPLPGETLGEFFAARERYLQELETFGPLFPPEPKRAGQGRAPPAKAPRQLTLSFD